jgi:hypothetical protein
MHCGKVSRTAPSRNFFQDRGCLLPTGWLHSGTQRHSERIRLSAEMGVRPKLRLPRAPARVQRQAVQRPRAQSAALRMRELGADSAAPSTAEFIPQPLRARDGAPQCTSSSSTSNHPAPFVKRPALAPMYTDLGLTSLDQVISYRKLRWAGHVRRMDWSRLPRKTASSSRRGSTPLAAEDGHTPTGTTSRASST